MRITIPVAFNCCIQRNRIRAFVTLASIIAIITIGPELHRVFLLRTAHYYVRNTNRRTGPKPAAKITMNAGCRKLGDHLAAVRIRRFCGDICIPCIVGRKDLNIFRIGFCCSAHGRRIYFG